LIWVKRRKFGTMISGRSRSGTPPIAEHDVEASVLSGPA